MAGPEPITPLSEGTSNQNVKSIIEGHDVSDEEVEDGMKGKEKVGDEDLSKPFKEVLKCPFTRRIVKFSSPCHRLPENAKIYDEAGDLEDHVCRFVGIENQEEWPMPEKFLSRFGMLKACDKDPTRILKIVRKANETLPHFKERWVSESNAIPNTPKLMQISSFMSSHKCPKLAKCFSDNIPKIVDEMLKRVDDYLRSEEAFRSTELLRGNSNEETHRIPERHTPYVPPQRPSQELHRPKAVLTLDSLSSTPQEILATKHQLHLPQPAPLVGVPSKKNLNRYCDYHNKKRHITNDCFHLKRQLEIVLESSKLNHLIKDARQRGKGGQRNNGPQKAKVINMVQCHPLDRKRKTTMTYEEWVNIPITFPPVLARDLSKEALVVEDEVEGYLVQRIHIDEGALVKPLGKIELDVCFGGGRRCRRAIMKFTVIPAPSHYNIIMGRPGLKQLRVIPSTIHGMMKFPTPWGVATILSQAPVVFECRREGKKKAVKPSENERMQGNISPTMQVKYPTWISNPVLVKKVDESWQMCIDFKNISAACPKDYYPLPEIDSKIEAVMGFPLKCFLDAYKGYHQVQLAEEDEEKTAFYTDQGTYCYTKMSFGLKNTGATYQRLVDEAFKTQIGRNLKAYIDDMVIKSKSKREMLADIAEMFDNLRRINMKLNPKKCLFGVAEGKFLGYMVTSEGIRANPANTKDLAKMYTNNQAEYEALLAGLRIAKKMGVQSLSVNVDSKLVASQINDILSKLASVAFNHLTKEILVETLDVLSMDVQEINAVVEEEGETWMTPIINYLEKGIWPEDQNEAHALQMKISQYVMEEGVLFKISYRMPMLRKVGGGKAIRQGYYWPTMHRDAREEICKCDSRQIQSLIPKLPKNLMTSIMAPWPFFQWGMDVLGPQPEAPRKVRYGLPKIIMTDNGTDFIHDPFKSWCKKLNITQINTTVVHLQANGLVERANRSLMEGIKTRLGRERKGWVDELPNVL
ncbi:reverse transcriptase domain-containing protein [Tanacetum coccineum]